MPRLSQRLGRATTSTGDRRSGLLPCLAVAFALACPTLASAATDATGATARAQGLSQSDVQGVGCIAAGAMGAIGAYVYNDLVVAAVAASASAGVSPILVLPLVISGFVTGCGVGSTIMPTVLHFTLGYQ